MFNQIILIYNAFKLSTLSLGTKKSFIKIINKILLMLVITCISIIGSNNVTISQTRQEELVDSKSAYLCEGNTGKVLYEKNSYDELPPASITKIMTLLLIFEELDVGNIDYDDKVTVSEHAASMGGSQVYLEEGEIQTVNDMIKCISIASANDACVAMAEFIAGSEDSFVEMMNDKAKELGMEHTHFVNCCGLDVENHYSCAADIATMGRELITKYPKVSEYATTWMDEITHVTRKGTKEFGLTNTNKLVRTYEGITGLKTGSTSKAGYCLCATSTRDGMIMVAVVMSSKDHKSRFSDCKQLMDYGYSQCELYTDDDKYEDELGSIKVKGSIDGYINGIVEPFSMVLAKGESEDNIENEILLNDIYAPISKGDVIGVIRYKLNGETVGETIIVADVDVKKDEYKDCLVFVIYKLFGKKD